MINASGYTAIFEIAPGMYAGCRVVAWSDANDALCCDGPAGKLAPASKREGFASIIEDRFLTKASHPLNQEAWFRRMIGIDDATTIRRHAKDAPPPDLAAAWPAACPDEAGSLYLECPTLPTPPVPE